MAYENTEAYKAARKRALSCLNNGMPIGFVCKYLEPTSDDIILASRSGWDSVAGSTENAKLAIEFGWKSAPTRHVG